jgi:hypothetical protein
MNRYDDGLDKTSEKFKLEVKAEVESGVHTAKDME